MFAITFKDGQPTHPSTSKTAVIPILSSANLPTGPVKGRPDRINAADCPGCIRPAGIAFDPKGRLFVASNGANVGEIFIVTRTDGKSVDSSTAEELELLEKSKSVPAIGLA
jgi:hypothetical protein